PTGKFPTTRELKVIIFLAHTYTFPPFSSLFSFSTKKGLEFSSPYHLLPKLNYSALKETP
ncbi:hypothetical protein, partial [Fusobacterium necrophorum]|uniref:hypothetical protein n=1 Tax=Fusobacterium necrophorum TaxID=859 RepID=UPI001C9BBC16